MSSCQAICACSVPGVVVRSSLRSVLTQALPQLPLLYNTSQHQCWERISMPETYQYWMTYSRPQITLHIIHLIGFWPTAASS
jgi:hypothetical protein